MTVLISSPFLLTSAFFAFGAVGVLLKHFFDLGEPDKISIERETTLVVAGINFLIGSAFFLLFWGIVKKRKWLPLVYWIVSAISIVFLFSITTPFGNKENILEDIAFSAVLLSIVAFFGMYFHLHKTSFNTLGRPNRSLKPTE